MMRTTENREERSPVIVRDVPVILKRFSLVAAAAPSWFPILESELPHLFLHFAPPSQVPLQTSLAPGRRNRQNHFNFKCQQLTQSQYQVEKFK